MPKWPQLADWPLTQLLRLKASWEEVRPGSDAEQIAHEANMAELEALIAKKVISNTQEEA